MYDDVINGFADYLHNTKKASSNTVSSYQRDLRKYCSYLEERGIKNCRDTNGDDLKEYIEYLKSKGFSDSTVSRNIASLRSFYGYLLNSEQASIEITAQIKAPKVEKKVPDILSVEEVERLLSQPSTGKPKHLRDKAMLELMYATGIRVTELISLKLSDLHLKGSYITCKFDNRQRVIPFGSQAKKALENYLNYARPALVNDVNMHLLFTNCNGGEMSRQGFWKLIKAYAAQAKIQTEITPHTLRHSFAVHLIENGAEIHAVSEMLGHSDISSTKVYVNMNNNRIRKIYESAHPRK